MFAAFSTPVPTATDRQLGELGGEVLNPSQRRNLQLVPSLRSIRL